ncbi:CHAP domain-containing protein [Hamadaea sp. NPDC050747]|uniref:CHAP domain-containing protein n=1 Tax=Hamadaea sp. NPDC050747 TaxID=3155789 RepID=UPI0033E1993F
MKRIWVSLAVFAALTSWMTIGSASAAAVGSPMNASNPAWVDYYTHPDNPSTKAAFCAEGGAAVFREAGGVPACGPTGSTPIWVPTDTANPASGIPTGPISGFQCVEFAERYLYVRYGLPGLSGLTGATLVDRYAQQHSYIAQRTNGDRTGLPAVGDVISFADNLRNPDGHVAIVTAVTPDAKRPGKGMITFLGQNQKLSGPAPTAAEATINYSDGVLQISSYNKDYRRVTWLALSALPRHGAVTAWGWNGNGETDVPTGLNNVSAIATGLHHTLAIKLDRTVVAWGPNYYGERSVPAGLNNVVAVGAADVHSVALKADGTVVAWGADPYGEIDVPVGLTGVTSIATGPGARFTLALKSDGTVVAWGSQFQGETSVPPGLSNVVAVAADAQHALALRADGTVIAWGSNYHNESIVPSGLSDVVAIAAGHYHSIALRRDGTIVEWGAADYYYNGVEHVEPLTPPSGSGFVAIAAGEDHDLALRSDGSISAWGANYVGQLNYPAGITSAITVSGGGAFSAAIIS